MQQIDTKSFAYCMFRTDALCKYSIEHHCERTIRHRDYLDPCTGYRTAPDINKYSVTVLVLRFTGTVRLYTVVELVELHSSF